MSLETNLTKEQKQLLENMNNKTETITKVIPFLNDDVPKYLKKLSKFYEQSKQTEIIITSYIF